MPESDLSKMKVADLKRELKVRGLSTSGNKNELQDRLQAALIDGNDDVLEDSCNISCEDELLGDADLTDDEEAKILGEDESDEALTSPLKSVPITSPLKLNTSTANNAHLLEDELLKSPSADSTSTSASVNPPKRVVLKRKISAPSASDNNSTQNGANGQSKENNAEQHTTSKVVKTDGEKNIGSSTEIDDAASSKNKLSHMSQQERLEMRRKKFGLAAEENSKKPLGKITNDLPNDPDHLEKLKKRAERFGCAVAPAIANMEAKEKLEQRKQRFGIASEATAKESVVTSTTSNSTDAWAEKARLRLERFNKGTTATASTATAK